MLREQENAKTDSLKRSQTLMGSQILITMPDLYMQEWNYSQTLMWQDSEWGWVEGGKSLIFVQAVFTCKSSNLCPCPSFSFCWDTSEGLLSYKILQWFDFVEISQLMTTYMRSSTVLNKRWHCSQYLIMSCNKGTSLAPLLFPFSGHL